MCANPRAAPPPSARPIRPGRWGVLAAGTGDASGTGDVSAVVELVVVVHAVSTADAQPRANARRDNWGSDESEGGEVFKEFSCDAAGTSVETAQAIWLAAWLSHPVKPHMIKHDDPRKQAKSARRV